MALDITKTFTVSAPPDVVWAFLLDPERVAACMPGAAVTGQIDERTYTGTMKVKVGPVTTSYKGKIVFQKRDADNHTAEVVATGRDVKGKGGAEMRLTSTLTEVAPGQTEVTAVSTVKITGILAQLGRGLIQDVSDQLFAEFSSRMRDQLEAAEAAKQEEAADASDVSATPAPSPAPSPAPAPDSDATAGAVETAAETETAAGSEAGSAAETESGAETESAAATAKLAAARPAVARPRAAPEVLDLGAIGSRALARSFLRTLTSPIFWLFVIAATAIIYYLATR